VQLARSVGARVIGTGRSAVKTLVLDTGADSFVDLEQSRWEDAVGQVDVVFDTIGGEVLARSVAIVKPGGALVTVTAPPPGVRDDIRVVNFIREPNRAQLVELARMVDAGQFRPQVGAVYALADAQKAFIAKSKHGVSGKVILQP
jgi:NADPH:quinone reductase-like Zn-dependent oxidoreductase